MNLSSKAITLIILQMIILYASGQQRDSTKLKEDKTSGIIVLPAIFFSPETSLGFGVAGMRYFRTSSDSLARPSNVQAVFIYTLENQVLATMPFNVFLNKDKHWLKGEWAYYIYPYQFYGVGSEVDLDTYEVYTADFLRMETNWLFKLHSDFYLGPTIFFDNYFNIEVDANGELATGDILGIEPQQVFGIGGSFILDKRNNLFSPSDGYYLEGRVLQYENRAIGDYSFTDMYIDARKYFSPIDRTEVGLQFYHQSILGDAPFYNLALLGGGRRMRGYYQGAYRDHHQTILQTETRRYLTKRIIFSAFGGLGSIAEEFGSYEKLLGSYGVGLRYEINSKEKIRIRVDYARGANTSGFYININEAF
ncbi:BamA/TamA family outer membrane protein [Marinoscillum sp.]|uniref:BamA/TamA family outer membrane protein n=1 Tax=Marinoscillum sp. TaxID=2024838 RepID=UPI003BA90FAB